MRATLVDPHSVGRATPLGYGHAVLLPDGLLQVVLQGPKQDGELELVNLAAEASRARGELPLPLLDGTPDWPNDAGDRQVDLPVQRALFS